MPAPGAAPTGALPAADRAHRRRTPCPSVPKVPEQPGLQVVHADTARRRDERADFAPTDETAAAELDALELAGARPGPDRGGPEPDVRCGEDLRGLSEADPVGGSSSHRQSPPFEVAVDVVVEDVDGGADVEDAADSAPVFVASPPPPASAAGLDDRDLLEAAADRSFFAHPEPLKWTAGVTKPLRIEPSIPQLGQNRGPAS